MSVSVDELVASLNASHVGQEAMDLQMLQSQLAQVLFSQAMVQETPRESYTQPCNTPTGRTPSNSISWGQMMEGHHRESVDEMEDERMVEDILIPSSPAPVSATSCHFPRQQSPARSRSQSKSISHPSYSAEPSSPFATTDPFYIAQVQAIQNHTASPSVFSQMGRPSQQSPFAPPVYQQQQQQQTSSFAIHRETHGYSSGPCPRALDTHSFLVTSSAAFER